MKLLLFKYAIRKCVLLSMLTIKASIAIQSNRRISRDDNAFKVETMIGEQIWEYRRGIHILSATSQLTVLNVCARIYSR